jgi:hypothetical protein
LLQAWNPVGNLDMYNQLSVYSSKDDRCSLEMHIGSHDIKSLLWRRCKFAI